MSRAAALPRASVMISLPKLLFILYRKLSFKSPKALWSDLTGVAGSHPLPPGDLGPIVCTFGMVVGIRVGLSCVGRSKDKTRLQACEHCRPQSALANSGPKAQEV